MLERKFAVDALQVEERQRRIAFTAIVLLFALPGVACAGGSVSLSEVMELSSNTRGLHQELTRSLGAAQSEADDVTCSATRIGRHLGALGGARVGPYECRIGNRIVTIRSKVELLDSEGRALQNDDPGVATRAVAARESEFEWEWRPAP